jgi:hypothetical protein
MLLCVSDHSHSSCNLATGHTPIPAGIFGHNSQFLVTAAFEEGSVPALDVIRDQAHYLGSYCTNLIGFETRRSYSVAVTTAEDSSGSHIFGADTSDFPGSKDWTNVDLSVLLKLEPDASRSLAMAIEDFRQALADRHRAPMLVHRILETLAWRYASDESGKGSLSKTDWDAFWRRLELADSQEKAWARDTLLPIATRIRHGREAPEARDVFVPSMELAQQVIRAYLKNELRDKNSNHSIPD